MASNENHDVSNEQLRFTDIADEPRRMLPPIEGYENEPLVSLEEAVQPLVKHICTIEQQAQIAKRNCKQNSVHDLTMDESASIRLYTMECKPKEQCLYYVLNQTLRSEDRSLLKDWFRYLRLIINALLKIPSSRSRLLFRGVKLNLSQDYPLGTKLFWWAFSSCTTSMEVLEKGPFLGAKGARTLFHIDCYSSRDIREYSAHAKECEALLLPARQFQIVSSLNAGNDLYVIHLREVEPEFTCIKIPPIVKNSSNIASIPPPVPLPDNPELESHLARLHHRSYLNLVGWRLSDQDMSFIAEQAVSNKQCVKVSIRNSPIASQGLLALAIAVRDSTTIEELDLSNANLTDNDLDLLAQHISIDQSLAIKQWSCCGLVKVKELLQAPIKILRLSDNHIGDTGIEYLVEVLKNRRTLLELHLNGNQISDHGVRLLATILSTPTSNLRKLYLHNNPRISDLGINHLIGMLRTNRLLNTLWLINCNLTNAGRQRLRDTVSTKKDFYLNVEQFN
ncbi:unnamed protein product [Adineta ricciae]|uniref:NAD(P)(+)--arginine ADP-ribosyltransferase n=1 Tax=Adineta ricciae TaxID=249248 RepID=A0A814FP88_ADIRI|nr:unnamed protein product [Adineta ricciae]CAF0984775.1 unnamed protein product [Adineta ricciae]